LIDPVATVGPVHGKYRRSAIDFPSMADCHDIDDHATILDPADNPIVADANRQYPEYWPVIAIPRARGSSRRAIADITRDAIGLNPVELS